MGRLWLACGGLVGLTAVGMAAFAAHGLPAWMDAAGVQAVRSGVQMQGWHALALVATGLWAERGGRLADLAGAAFLAGVIVFCGAVYTTTLAAGPFGPAAPVGGTLLMLGWLLLTVSAVFPRR